MRLLNPPIKVCGMMETWAFSSTCIVRGSFKRSFSLCCTRLHAARPRNSPGTLCVLIVNCQGGAHINAGYFCSRVKFAVLH